MAGIMTAALKAAKLIDDKQFDAEQARARLLHVEANKKQFKGSRGSFTSLRQFMTSAEKRLRQQGYSARLVLDLQSEGHQVVTELNLSQKKRGRMHAFFARLGPALSVLEPDELSECLARTFRQFDPDKIDED